MTDYDEMKERYLEMDRDISEALGLEPLGEDSFPEREAFEDGPIGFVGDIPVPVVKSKGLQERDAMGSLSHTAAKVAAQAYDQRYGKEALGAWRAGYDYLDVVQPQTFTSDPTELELSIRAAFLPRHELPTGEEPSADYGPDVMAERVDLGELTNDDVAELRRRLFDDG